MNEPTSIQELAELAVQRRGVSGRRLADVAERLGHQVSHATINKMRSGVYTARPSDAMVRALAELAMVSEEVAFAAAGKPLPGPPLADRLPDGVDNLSEQSKKVIYELAKALINAEQGQTADDHEDGQDHTRDQQHADSPTRRERGTGGLVGVRGGAAGGSGDARSGQKSAAGAAAPADGHDDELDALRERRQSAGGPGGGHDGPGSEDGPEVDEDGVPLDPELKRAYFLGMAANRGTSTMDEFNRRQAELGEESQDGQGSEQ